MKVLITPRGFASYGLKEIELMRNKGLEVHYNDTGVAYTPAEFLELARDVDAIIVGVDLIDRAVMEACPNLKVICKFGVGTDNIDLECAKERNIHVGRTVGSNSLAVAEHVMALMFAESKNLYKTIDEVKQGQWNKYTGVELHAKTLGIIGFGAIGKHLARMAKGIGMTVYAYDAFPIKPEDVQEYGVTVTDLDTIYRNADYISLHVPLMDDTRNMISTHEFELMKASVCLVNAARGGIVDEKALYTALVNKEIRSAAFDVFSQEPPEKGNELLGLDNFILTSHTAARTQESEKRTCEISTNVILQQLNID